jgi:hypothetical protein
MGCLEKECPFEDPERERVDIIRDLSGGFSEELVHDAWAKVPKKTEFCMNQ